MKTQQIVEEVKKLQETWKFLRLHGAISMADHHANKVKVQLRAINFIECFPWYEIEERDCEEYPYRLQATIGGAQVYTIVSDEEMAEIKKAREIAD